MFPEDITTDADEDALEESLKGFDISVTVPQPSENAGTAATWVKSPDLMLKSLTERLNDVLSICEARLFDGIQIQVKHEYLEEHRTRTPPDRVPALIVSHSDITFIAMISGHNQKRVDLVNSIQPTPFSGEIIRDVNREIDPGNTKEFDQAITRWKKALQQLADWIRMRQLLDGNADIHDNKPQSRSSENVEIQKVISEDPRTEIIRQIIRDNPDWVNGKRDAILEEVKVRYKNPENGRNGVGRVMGLQIIRSIVENEIEVSESGTPVLL